MRRGGGTGTLTVACDTVSGSSSRNGLIAVWPSKDGYLKIENVDLRVSGENNCLKGPNVIVDQAAITVGPSQHGTPDDSVIYADTNVTINGSVVTGTTENAMWGICANNGDLTISDSTVKLTETVNKPAGYLDWGCYALEGYNRIFVTNSDIDIQTEMTEAATSSGGTSTICGMLTFNGNLSICGSKVKITQDNRSPDQDGSACGIVAVGGSSTISITQNSEVTVSALNNFPTGVQTGGTLEVDGSVVVSTATSTKADDEPIEFYYGDKLVLNGVAVVEGTWVEAEKIITCDPVNFTGGRSVIRPIGTDASLASVTLDTVEGRVSDTDIAIELPAGSALPTDGTAFAIVPTDARATVGTPVTADGGATWTFAVTAEDGVTSRNYTIHVTIAPATCAVHVNAGEGGTVTGAGTYTQGASVTVTAVPNSGYTFVKWTENGLDVSTDASYTFVASGKRSLVAVFERKAVEPAAKPTAGPAAAPAAPPKTGDDASLGLWMAALAASLAGIAVLLRKRTIKQR